MKKLILLLPVICMIFTGAGQAQMQKGKIMVGVGSTINLPVGLGSDLISLGFSTSKSSSSTGYSDEPYKTVRFNLIPKVGFFVIDNLSVGLNIIISHNGESDTGNNDKYTVTMFGAAPFARYYFPVEKIHPFVELTGGFGNVKDKSEYGTSSYETKYNMTMFGGGAGIALPVGNRVTFDIMAGYSSITEKETDQGVTYKDKIGTIGLTMGFAIFLGKLD